MKKKTLAIIIIALLLVLTIAPSINAFVFTGESQFKASSEGLVIEGHGSYKWRSFFDNAQGYFWKWCDSLQSAGPPRCTPDWISKRISNPDVEFFYVIAHSDGQSDRFRANASGVYYTADQLHDDMEDRSPMKLAILCCCEAMTDTGPGSLSWEFRKGQSEGTVVIGYTNMGECPGTMWDALDWQDNMFNLMDRGFTVKKAFDIACTNHPTIANYVKFVGDTNLKAENNPLSPPEIKLKLQTGLYVDNVKERSFPITIVVGDTNIEVNATDDYGINRVEFYIDDDLKETDTTSPYIWTWDEFSFGRHTLTVKAYDNAGNSATDEMTVWKFF